MALYRLFHASPASKDVCCQTWPGRLVARAGQVPVNHYALVVAGAGRAVPAVLWFMPACRTILC